MITAAEAGNYLRNSFNPHLTRGQIVLARKFLKSVLISKGREDDVDYNKMIFSLARDIYTAEILFDKAVATIGMPLWKEKAWRDNMCFEQCPYGERCDKKLRNIDGDYFRYGKFCYGQIYADIPYPLPKAEKDYILRDMYLFRRLFGFKRENDTVIGGNVIKLL